MEVAFLNELLKLLKQEKLLKHATMKLPRYVLNYVHSSVILLKL